jgi:hypothetical protein
LSAVPARKAEPPALGRSLRLRVVHAPGGAVYPLILEEQRGGSHWLALPVRLVGSLRAQLEHLVAAVKSRRWQRPLLCTTPPLGEKTL